MTLTPIEIHNKQFSRSFRGFNEDEVNDFLNLIISDYEQFIRQEDQMKKEIDNNRETIKKFREIHDSVNSAFTSAQEASKALKDKVEEEAALILQDAKINADLILKEAEENSDKIVNEALSMANKIAVENEAMINQISDYKGRFASFVETQLKQFLHGDWNDFEIPNNIAENANADLIERGATRDISINNSVSNSTVTNPGTTSADSSVRVNDDYIFDELMKEYEKKSAPNRVSEATLPTVERTEEKESAESLDELIAKMNEGLKNVSNSFKTEINDEVSSDGVLNDLIKTYDDNDAKVKAGTSKVKDAPKKELRFKMKRNFN